jgi:FixJ family two-component response regulator
MTTAQPLIYVVDDDAAVRTAIRLLLRSANLLVEAYASADEFLSHFDADRHGCIVLDVRMPGLNGLELQDKLNELHVITPIIFITGHGDVPMAVEAMQHGALDFIQKPFQDQDLLNRIHAAISRDQLVRRELTERETIRTRLNELTPREREVLTLVAEGRANKVIAGDLDLSQRTVEIHRARVMEKMQANSLAHLVRMVIALELDQNAK